MDRINRGEPFWGYDPKRVEDVRQCRYVGDFCLRTRDGGWSEQPAAVFWQETPPDPSYSNYFGLTRRMEIGENGPQWGALLITGAGCVAEGVWWGQRAADGEIIYSRWRHDYRRSADGTAMVDGGRDYFKSAGTDPVCLRVSGPDLVLVPRNEWPTKG